VTGLARLRSPRTTRAVALVAVAALLGASLQVLYHFIDVTGTTAIFLATVAVTLLGATVLARVLRPWLAVPIGILLLAAGLGWYVLTTVGDPQFAVLVADAISLFFGRSLLHIDGINAWVLGVSPAPVFLTWYFAMRRNYVPAVVIAGASLGFLVLTTDADAVTTLFGVVAGAAAVAIGDVDRRGEPIGRAETVLTVLAVMIVVPAIVSVVPAGAGAQVTITEELLGEEGTLEESLVTEERVAIQGSITLSPEVRFTVESDRAAYWRVASYDRYTGDGWVRTGSLEETDARFDAPEGTTRALTQTISAETEIQRMPAAWKPVEVSRYDGQLLSASDGSIQPGRALEAGETYTVRSQVPAAAPGRLQNASGADPEHIAQRYTQLPASTPERVTDRTATLTANAETRYETALTIQRWLRNNREYSLSVRRPQGNVADAFLFEMDRGYCTYYATTMVAMLRSQDIPARFVTGYRPGERVDDDEWVVRGLNAHAWVEVYFPGQGWQRFEPTPSGPRDAVRSASIEEARQEGEETVDTDESRARANGTGWTPTPTETPLTPTPTAATTASPNGTATNGSSVLGPDEGGATGTFAPLPGEDGGGLGWVAVPTRQQLALGVVALAGLAVGLRRTRLVRRAHRAVWLRYQPRRDPATDVERAFQRVLDHVQRTSDRRRSPSETVRAYFEAVDADPATRRVARIRERARYGGRVTEADADAAVDLADDLVR
jgi:hypothetical protein